jgi:RNA polymerase sigma-70 factor, ECF subfamily
MVLPSFPCVELVPFQPPALDIIDRMNTTALQPGSNPAQDFHSATFAEGCGEEPLLDLRERLGHAAPEVHRFVARRMSNFADAADVAQQTMLIASLKLSTFRNGDLNGWLFAIARNLLVDHYRTQNRFQFAEIEDLALAENESALRTSRESVSDACDHRARLHCYLTCISQRLCLSEEVAILLAEVYGHADKVSAASMNLSVPSFKLLLHKARTNLQEAAGGNCSLAHRGMAAPCEACIKGSAAKAPPAHQTQAQIGALLALRAKLRQGLGVRP